MPRNHRYPCNFLPVLHVHRMFHPPENFVYRNISKGKFRLWSRRSMCSSSLESTLSLSLLLLVSSPLAPGVLHLATTTGPGNWQIQQVYISYSSCLVLSVGELSYHLPTGRFLIPPVRSRLRNNQTDFSSRFPSSTDTRVIVLGQRVTIARARVCEIPRVCYVTPDRTLTTECVWQLPRVRWDETAFCNYREIFKMQQKKVLKLGQGCLAFPHCRSMCTTTCLSRPCRSLHWTY